MGSDAREIGLDNTAQAPAPRTEDGRSDAAHDRARSDGAFEGAHSDAAFDGTQDASQPSTKPLAVGTADTAAPRAKSQVAELATPTRVLFVVVATLAAIELVYFTVRFVIAADPPTLHRSFIGRSGDGAFASLDIFNGPYLTLIRMISVATIFLVYAIWAARQFRREPRAQIIAAFAVVVGTYSLAVAVLTSSEDLLAARLAAAASYVALPLVACVLAVLFPNGRAVPRWGAYLIPFAMIPFVMQALVMFRDHTFSVPIAAAYFPGVIAFFAMQRHRYRKHATVRERSQIKWLCYAGAAYALIQGVTIVVVIPLLSDRDSAAFPFVRIIFELLIAASYLVALASLLFSGARYRVWDIDRVINRTIVYSIVTVLLVAASAVAFFGLRALVANALPPAASIVLALGAVIGLAAPLRRRIARWIDRRFYGIGLDYEGLAAKAVRAAHSELPTTGVAFASYDELVLLGRGGMGAVYRAHHADFGVPVALKVMSPKLAGDADAQARFRRESQILEDLQHVNVIPFLAAGHEAGLAFIAMQYIDGEDLGALVRRRGPLPIREAAPLIAGVAAALDLAHSRGVIHRDIKPANIFVEGAPSDATRRALVMDFGVARLADDPRAPDASLVGSLPYIAPEQIHDADAVDHRADVYALGATAYEVVTGRPPFVESTALGLVLAHLHQPPIDPRAYTPELPTAAAHAILKALAKDPAQRHASAGAFAAALRGST